MKRMTLIAASLSTALLAGCDVVAEYGVTDKKAQQELFFKCMEKLPAGHLRRGWIDGAERQQ